MPETFRPLLADEFMTVGVLTCIPQTKSTKYPTAAKSPSHYWSYFAGEDPSELREL